MNFVNEQKGNDQIDNAVKNEGEYPFLSRSHLPRRNHTKLPEDHYVERWQNKGDSEDKPDKSKNVLLPDEQHSRHPPAQ